MIDLGFNYRLSDLSCALGLSQLTRLPENISRRREIVHRYNMAFAELDSVVSPMELPDAHSVWHLYPIRLNLNALNVGRKEVFQALRAENLEVNVHYIPVHLHPYYQQRFGYREGDYPNAEGAYHSLITLPLFHSMSDQDVEDVIEAVWRVFGYFASES